MNTPKNPSPIRGGGGSTRSAPAHPPAPDRKHAEAERRRAGLRTLLEQKRLTVTDLSRLTGMATANRFFNFLNGHAASLFLETLEAILILLPTVSFEELVGWSGRHAPPSGVEEL